MTDKPPVATVLTLGWGIHTGERYPALVGQVRNFVNADTGLPVTHGGLRSLWGKHINPQEKPLRAAARCVNEEFWRARKSRPRRSRHFIQVGAPVETELTVNTLFFLTQKLDWRDLEVREGGGAFFAPLERVASYAKLGYLTEASVAMLKIVPSLEALWDSIPE